MGNESWITQGRQDHGRFGSGTGGGADGGAADGAAAPSWAGSWAGTYEGSGSWAGVYGRETTPVIRVSDGSLSSSVTLSPDQPTSRDAIVPVYPLESILGGGIAKSAARAAVAAILREILGSTRADPSKIQFAQQGISDRFRNGEFAGRSIYEVASEIEKGHISPGKLPISVINRDGVTYTMNNRSLMALRLAGREPTVVNDVTGVPSFEKSLTARLKELGTTVGPKFLPNIRGK